MKLIEKKKSIYELQRNQHIVVLVGGGINNAAVPASSLIGTTLGEGVESASEASFMALMVNWLSLMLDILELLRLTMKTVTQNL